jgi:hypothetical protein
MCGRVGIVVVSFVSRHGALFVKEVVTANPSRKLHVSLHQGDAASVDGAQERVLEQTCDVGLCSLLQG